VGYCFDLQEFSNQKSEFVAAVFRAVRQT